jgi:predicted HicB family RNase H-like nuclease
MMEYKGYLAKVEFDDEANLFHGQVVNIRDVITFQGQSVDELRSALADSVEDYLEFCAQRNRDPEKPFSGRFLVRIDPVLHREIAIAASRAHQSINAWVTEVFQQAVRPRSAASQATSHPSYIEQVSNQVLQVVVARFQMEGRSYPKIPAALTTATGMTFRKQVFSPDRTIVAGELIELIEEDLINAA